MEGLDRVLSPGGHDQVIARRARSAPCASGPGPRRGVPQDHVTCPMIQPTPRDASSRKMKSVTSPESERGEQSIPSAGT